MLREGLSRGYQYIECKHVTHYLQHGHRLPISNGSGGIVRPG